MEKKDEIRREVALYFFFALCMIILNYIIQKSNQIYIAPFICQNYGFIDIIQTFYCSTTPFNMSELVGSIGAVGITYIVKFFLDKYIVFKKKDGKIKDTSEEFIKYLFFAIITTIENIGIQFILTNFFGSPLEISIIIALSIGYATKYVFDRKYVFNKEYLKE